MRTMADSVTAADLPTGFDLYGAYDDGSYDNVNAVKARFPGKPVVPITVFARDDFGTVLDVENGDATAAQAPSWCTARRALGVIPTVYTSDGNWQSVRDAFSAANVPEPNYWIAAYPGNGAQLYPGAVAHQWIDRGPYDESVVADYWPGVDPAPVPPTPPPVPPIGEVDDMCVIETTENGVTTRNVFGIINGVAYHWYQTISPTVSAWQLEELPKP